MELPGLLNETNVFQAFDYKTRKQYADSEQKHLLPMFTQYLAAMRDHVKSDPRQAGRYCLTCFIKSVEKLKLKFENDDRNIQVFRKLLLKAVDACKPCGLVVLITRCKPTACNHGSFAVCEQARNTCKPTSCKNCNLAACTRF